jgi:signal transduction histidine kinase
VGGLPLLVVAYPVYIVLCVGLALDALLRPGPTGRMLGDQARRRARPWLAAASGLLLLVSLLVAWVMGWLVSQLRVNPAQPLVLDAATAQTIAWFDLTISGLIAAALLLLGQALVAYEVFTGHSLPRRGLLRHWRNAVALALGYGLLAGWSLAVHLRPVYSVLLSLALLSVFYALFSWRAYAERDRYMRQLRPFVASQQLYEHLMEQAQAAGAAEPAGEAGAEGAPAAPGQSAATVSFQALCRDVLGTRLAYLMPLGPAALLAGPPLVFAEPGAPALPAAGLPALAALAARIESRRTTVVELDGACPGGEGDPGTPNGIHLALPLWAERRAAPVAVRETGGPPAGLIGLLLLGEKTGGGLYAQEEIDIARAAGERLIDTLASAELARRLLALQRQRLAESQVVDQRTRRVLHDDVLPQLHAALLHLHAHPAATGTPVDEAAALLAVAHRQLAELLRELPGSPLPDVARLGLVDALRRLAAGEFARAFDRVEWGVAPEAEAAARALPVLAAEVIFFAAREAMRNAARHARPAGGAPPSLRLGLERPPAGGLVLTLEDNGVGPGAAAADGPAGTGQGLALHSTLLAVVGGTLTVEREAGRFTRVRLVLPAGIAN